MEHHEERNKIAEAIKASDLDKLLFTQVLNAGQNLKDLINFVIINHDMLKASDQQVWRTTNTREVT